MGNSQNCLENFFSNLWKSQEVQKIFLEMSTFESVSFTKNWEVGEGILKARSLHPPTKTTIMFNRLGWQGKKIWLKKKKKYLDQILLFLWWTKIIQFSNSDWSFPLHCKSFHTVKVIIKFGIQNLFPFKIK